MAMARRGFIRIVGGGVVLAAAGAVAAPRLDAMPAEAVEGWNGPSAEVADIRRRALAWAILAPNPHNLQSWKVDLREPGVATLYVDRARLLPHTDPHSRQILIGHGAFLELLSLAAGAEGHRVEIETFPEGAFDARDVDDRPVARIRFVKGPAMRADPLHAQIPRRRTTKTAFDGRPVSAADAAALAAAVAGAPGIAFAAAVEPDRVATLRRVASAGSELEMRTPRTLKESIDVARIGAAEIARHRDGISLHGPMMWALRHAGLMTPEKALTPGTMAFQGGLDYAMKGYASAASFGWLATDDNSRAAQIAAGRAYARLALAASARGVAIQPHSQTLQEYPEMAGLFADMRRETGTADARTLQMFFRLGYAAEAAPSPRRPAGSFVVA